MSIRGAVALAVLIVFLPGLLLPISRAADDAPKAAEAGTLIVIDQAGKEHKLKSWKILTGTRHLSWLVPLAPAPDEKTNDKAQPARPRPLVGPEALEVREDNSTNLAQGILTLVPLERIRSIDYDADKKSVTVRVATSARPEDDEKLTGTTRFAGENKLVIEAEVDRGDMGIAAIKFQGGVVKGIRAVRFPPPQVPAAAAAGRTAQITASDKAKTVHKASDFQALYVLTDGGPRVLSTLGFKKSLKVELANLKRLKVLKSSMKDGTECAVVFKDGEEQVLTMLRPVPIADKPAILEGLIGRVKVGYKVFPMPAILELQFDDGEKK